MIDVSQKMIDVFHRAWSWVGQAEEAEMTDRAPTLSDVAALAGVSYATADRVVNARGGVAEKSARRVRAAVRQLGYIRNVAAANLSQRRIYRFAVVLPAGPNAFFAHMRALLAEAQDRLAADRVALSIIEVPAFDAGALAARLMALGEDDLDGLALVGTDDAEVLTALAALRARGVAVVSLVSDLPDAARDAYVGIDNAVAGRTAARMIGLGHGGRAGRVLPIVGAVSAPDHAQRLNGLRAVLDQHYPTLTLAPEIEGRDRHDEVETQLTARLATDPAISAIYSIGAGNAGLIRVLEQWPGDRPRPFVVVHELVAHTRAALERGVIDLIIDQRPGDEIALALGRLREIADRTTPTLAAEPVVPALYVPENLPPATAASLAKET